MLEENFIPRKLQENKIMLWETNEFFILFLSVGTGLIFNQLLIGIIAGLLINKFFKKFNKNGRSCFLWAFLYWNFPSSFSVLKNTPPSHLRTFIK